MSPLDSFLFLASVVATLWLFWVLLNFVFDCIANYQAAWREERQREESQAARERGD